jgi:hypothetical protein
MRLKFLVQETGDPVLKMHVIDNLVKGVPPESKYYGVLERYQQEMRGEIIRYVSSGRTRLINRKRHDRFINRQWETLRKQQAWEQAKQAELFQGILHDLAQGGPTEIGKKLADSEPLVRWLAIQAVAKYRLPLEAKLIDMLADPHPAVQQGARQALVRLSRGTDLGPMPLATREQIDYVQGRWRQWLQAQVPMPEPQSEGKESGRPQARGRPGRGGPEKARTRLQELFRMKRFLL